MIGSIRRECLDHLVILGEAHLRRILRNYASYYNKIRTHRSLDEDAHPAKLKSQAHRLLSEIHSLNEANLKILDELRTVAPATASLLRYRYDAIAPTMRDHTGQALAYVH